MAPSPKVKRTYMTRQKDAERLEKLAKENHKKKRSRDPSSDDDSSPQTLGSFELGLSEIQIIPPWSDDDDNDKGEEGDDEVEVLGRMDVGSCSGVKKDDNFAKNVCVIDVDVSDEEEEKINEESCSSYGSVGSLFDDEEHENSDDEEDEDYKCEKKDKKGKMKKGNVVTSKYTCRKDLSLVESYSVDEFNGRKGKTGRDGEESVKGKKKGGKVLILDESGSSGGDSVVVIWPKEDAFKKKKAALP